MSFFDRYFTVTPNPRLPNDRQYDTKEPKLPLIIRDMAIAVFTFVLLIMLWPFHVVPTGYRGVVTQFGAIKGIEPEGLVTLPPWQGMSYFNVRAEESKVENADGATSDTQPVTVSMMVRYAINTDKVADVFEKYSRNGDLSSYVNTATHETFKAVTARYTAPDLIARRQSVSSDVFSLLNVKLGVYGAHVINIDMTNFAFQKAYMDAINDKVTQEQKKLAADNKLKTVESEQKQQVVVAEATAASVKAKADGDAYSTLTNARAAADALRLQNAAIRESKDILELKRIEVARIEAERWDGVRVPTTQLIVSPTPIAQVK